MISLPERRWRLLVALMAVLPLWAADTPSDILKAWNEAQRQNDERARQYTYTEQADRFTFTAGGQLRKDSTETTEVIFVEGTPFRKLVSRNGNPLEAREQARVDKEMQETAAERRKHHPPPAEGGKIFFGKQSADLGSRAELFTMFENRLLGEDTVGGRKAWVFESTPGARVVATNAHEKEVLCFRKRLWIDQEDHVLAKAVYTVIGDELFAKPGSTLTFVYGKIGPDTWHEVSSVLDIYRVRDKAFKPSGKTEYRLTNFQKFDVQSTITTDPAK